MPNATQLASANETENDFRSHHFTPLDLPSRLKSRVLGVGSCASRATKNPKKVSQASFWDLAKRRQPKQSTRVEDFSNLISPEVLNLRFHRWSCDSTRESGVPALNANDQLAV
jgi:hypothetical protein